MQNKETLPNVKAFVVERTAKSKQGREDSALASATREISGGSSTQWQTTSTETKMKTATIALLGAAALFMPAMAQDQNANQNAYNPPANQTEMNKTQPGSQGQTAGESQMNTQSQTGQMQLSSSEVKSIQEKLQSEGFHSGPADGKFGPETKAALEQCQKKNGLSATGEPDQKTLTAL